jgi:hypothetical protein
MVDNGDEILVGVVSEEYRGKGVRRLIDFPPIFFQKVLNV